MTPPLFVDENGDLAVFDSIQDACRYLEPVDVLAGVYRAFDASGTPLALSVRPGEGGRREVVMVLTAGPPSEQALLNLLRARLDAIGVSASGKSLAALVESARASFLTR